MSFPQYYLPDSMGLTVNRWNTEIYSSHFLFRATSLFLLLQAEPYTPPTTHTHTPTLWLKRRRSWIYSDPWPLITLAVSMSAVLTAIVCLQNAILSPLLFALRAHLKVCAGRNKSPVCFYAVITVSQACNPQRSDNDIAPAFITWRRGERENADFEQMNTLTFMQ